MAKKTARKLFLFGRYSLALLLPKKWLSEQGVKRGDSVGLEYDRKRGRIVVRIGGATAPLVSKPPKKRPDSPPPAPTDQLEPIPEL